MTSERTLSRSFNVTLALIMLYSLYPMETIGGFGIIEHMSRELNIHESYAESALYLTFGLGLACGEFIIGPLSDKYGRLRIIIILLNIYSVASLLCALHYSPIWFDIFRLLAGFSVAASVVITRTIISDHCDIQEGAAMLSLVSMFGLGLTGLYPVFLEYAIAHFHIGWRSFFIFNAIICSGVSVLVFQLMTNLQQDIKPHALEWNTITRNMKNTCSQLGYLKALVLYLCSAILRNALIFAFPIIIARLKGSAILVADVQGMMRGFVIFIVLFTNKSLLKHGVNIICSSSYFQAALLIASITLAILTSLYESTEHFLSIFIVLYLLIIGLLVALDTNLFILSSESLDKSKVDSGFIASLTISIKGFCTFVGASFLSTFAIMTTQDMLHCFAIGVLITSLYLVANYRTFYTVTTLDQSPQS